MPHLSADSELVLAIAACCSLALAVGHIIGAWPGEIIRERNARTRERDAAVTEAGALQRQVWEAEEQLDRERNARKAAERRASTAECQYYDLLRQLDMTGDN